ncbi:MAG: tyrosine recombinase [Mycobacterium sp.]|jgi:site-specific recombinase XerD|nr:tyrosine recombinase [Mycobacterium sp.]
MGNDDLLARFATWLLSSDRSTGTIDLRMRHARDLAMSGVLVEMTTEDIEGVMARRRHLSPETRKSQLASWRVLFAWAHKRGIRSDDPTADIRSIRVPVRVPRVAPDADIEAALIGATPQQRAMVLLARYGCLRLSELTTLPTRAREGERLRVIGKGDKERIVHANEPLLFALHALEREQGAGYYFPGLRGPHMHPMSVNKIITRLTGWNPHSLRHAGATAAYNATGDLRGVQEMLGHASLATTQRYLHLDDAARRRVAEGTLMAGARQLLAA